MTVKRQGGPSHTAKAGEYRVWLSEQPSFDGRRRLLASATAQSLRISMDEGTATFTFTSSGDLMKDVRAIDVLLEEAGGANRGSE